MTDAAHTPNKKQTSPLPEDLGTFGTEDDIDVPVYRRNTSVSRPSAPKAASGAKASSVSKVSAEETRTEEKSVGKNSQDELRKDNEVKNDTSSVNEPRDIYEVLGRAKPQKIEPVKPESQKTTAAATAPAEHPAQEDPVATIVMDSVGGSSAPQAQEAKQTQEHLSFLSDSSAQSEPTVSTQVLSHEELHAEPSADDELKQGQPLDVQEAVASEEEKEKKTASTAQQVVASKRGTLPIALLLLRLVFGGLLLVHGLQTLFGFGGSPGVEALSRQLNAYALNDWIAFALPVLQVAGGGLLVLGLMTPLGAALAAVATGFLVLHNLNTYQGGLWPYALNANVQMWLLYFVGVFTVIFSGPGTYAIDRTRGWATRPLGSAWVFAIITISTLVGVWLAIGGGNPLN